MLNKNKNRGFTLMELLVVIAIIGMLAATVLVSLSTARAKGRDAKRISDLKNLELALQLYSDANQGIVPSTIYGNTAFEGVYLQKVPLDPVGNTQYNYFAYKQLGGAANRCLKYAISTSLEGDSPVLVSDIDLTSAEITATGAVCAGAAPYPAGMADITDKTPCVAATDAGVSCFTVGN